MACAMAWPCAGPNTRVRRISMSSVPCSRSIFSASLWVDILAEHRAAWVECQGESCNNDGSREGNGIRSLGAHPAQVTGGGRGSEASHRSAENWLRFANLENIQRLRHPLARCSRFDLPNSGGVLLDPTFSSSG